MTLHQLCEGRMHPVSGAGHRAADPAGYAVTCACPNCGFERRILLCRARVEHVLANGLPMECERCRRAVPVSAYWAQLDELAGQSMARRERPDRAPPRLAGPPAGSRELG